MSTKSKKRRAKRHLVHRRPTEAMVQKVLRLQRHLHRAVVVHPGKGPTALISELVKKLDRASGDTPRGIRARRQRRRG